MRRFLCLFVSLSLSISLCSPVTFAQTSLSEQKYEDVPAFVEGEVIVTLTDDANTELTKPGTYSSDLNIEVENSWDFGDINISEISSEDLSTKQLIDHLSDEEHVVSVEPNYYRKKMSTNDTYRSFQWYLNNESYFQQTSMGIREEAVSSSVDCRSTIAAVVDTGIDYTHEDLRDHMWINPYSSLEGIYGYDFGDYDSDPMDEDEDGHGTHCAGIISAVRNNERGIAGISDARLMALKVFDKNGDALDSYIISAFNYIYRAQTLGANIAVVNCSWGGGGATPTFTKKLIEKIGGNGSLFVFAAGNNSINHDKEGTTFCCPYDIKSDYVIRVGASDNNDERAAFSDYGKSTVDLFAPGDRIISTVSKDTFVPFLYSEEQRKKLCSFYSSFDTSDTMLYTPPEIGQKNNNMTYRVKEYSNYDFFGANDSGSFSISFNTTQEKANCELFLDVTDLNLNTRNSYFVSYEMGMKENGTISWEHYVTLRNNKSFVNYGGRTYLRIVGLSGDFRNLSEIYIDNPAISVAVTGNVSFGKYNLLSGTSMAAPAVSAAVALLSAMYPSDSAAQRKQRLLKCTSPRESLSQFCITGGILDLSKLSTATYDLPTSPETPIENDTSSSKTITSGKKVAVKKIKLNKKKATLRYGKKLKLKATVTPRNATNKKVKWSVSNKKYATVTQKGIVKPKKRGIGHKVKIYAKAKDGSGKKAVCTVKLKRKH